MENDIAKVGDDGICASQPGWLSFMTTNIRAPNVDGYR